MAHSYSYNTDSPLWYYCLMRDEIVLVLVIMVGGGMAVAIKNQVPIWMGLVAGLMVASVIIGADLLLRLIPAYRRRRPKYRSGDGSTLK